MASGFHEVSPAHQEFAMTEDLIDGHVFPRAFQKGWFEVPPNDLFGPAMTPGDNINDVGTSLQVMFNEFIDPPGQIDHIPLSVVVKAVRRQYHHVRMRLAQAPEFL